jgi:aspartyl protease family protein
VFAVLGVIGLVAGGAWVLRTSGSSTEARPEPQFDYGPKAERIRRLSWELEREPCNRLKALDYVKAVFHADDLRGTIQISEDFISRCGKFTQLRHLTYAAHTRLSEFDLAIRDATELIDSEPNNVGYWIWRGMAHQAAGDSEKALADFQEAFNLQPGQAQVANQLASIYERLRKPCDALLVLLQHLQANPAELGRAEMMERMELLEYQGSCDVGGRGRAVISVGKGGTMWVEPLVNGKARGRFVLDTGASMVALSQEFADKLGLQLENARTVPVHTANGQTTARLTMLQSIELQGARAENITVGVTSTLPPGMDGLLGLSFLARFEMKLDAKTGRLELTERKRVTRSHGPR